MRLRSCAITFALKKRNSPISFHPSWGFFSHSARQITNPRMGEKKLTNLIPPILGFVICLALWLNLSRPAIVAGSIWMAAGIAFGVWKTSGFREQLSFETPAE